MMRLILVTLSVVALSIQTVHSQTDYVRDLFYKPIVNLTFPGSVQEFPVLLDASRAVGSTSRFGNASGILMLVGKESEAAALSATPPTRDFIALISQAMFQKYAGVIKELDRCTGFLIFDSHGDSSLPASGSPDHFVPNYEHGMAFDTLDSQIFNIHAYGVNGTLTSQSQPSTHFTFFDQPVLRLAPQFYDDVFGALDNATSDGGMFQPGASISMQMNGAGNAEVCLRRKTCAVLGGFNSWGTLIAGAKNQKMYMVAAPIDGLALFHDRIYGVDPSVSGFVTVLAVADVLARYASNSTNAQALTDKGANIMFNFFDGEALGYIGSSKQGANMVSEIFPGGNITADDAENFNFGLSDVKGYVEVGQVLAAAPDATAPLYAYASNSNAEANAIVTKIQNAFAASTVVDKSSFQVPPASLRSLMYEVFRKEGSADSFNGVFLGDFDEAGYKSKFYHSRLDTVAAAGGEDSVEGKIAAVAAGVARAVWHMATETDPTTNLPSVDTTLISDLLECYTVDQNCKLINEQLTTSVLPATPINRYVGVSSSSASTNANLIYQMLAKTLSAGKTVPKDKTKGGTSLYCMNETANEYPNIQAVGKLPNDTDCTSAYVYHFRAWSPAFNGNSLKPVCGDNTPYEQSTSCRDPRHSTWTESYWNTPSGFLIQVGDEQSQVAFFSASLAYFVVVLYLTHYLSTRLAPDFHRGRRVSLLTN